MSSNMWPAIKVPKAAQREHVRDIHGEQVVDPYYWLNDYFKQGPLKDEVVEYLTQENDYHKQMMVGTEALQENMYNEIRGRIKEEDESVPTLDNGYYYYTRTVAGGQYCKYYRKQNVAGSVEELILDVDALAEGKPYYMVGSCVVSPDNHWLAYTVDDVSRRQYKIYFKNLVTGETIYDGITNASDDIVWAADSETIFYVRNNVQTLLSEKIYRHRRGTPVTEDVLVYDEKDTTNYIGVSKSKTGDYIFIETASKVSSETFYISAHEPTATFVSFQPRMKDVLYQVVALEDYFLVLTNKDALNFQLMKTPLDQTGVEHWETFIAHRRDVLIEDVDEFKDYLVIKERYDGLARLVIWNRATNQYRYVQFDEPTYMVSGMDNPEYVAQSFRYEYTSLITPHTQYEEDMRTGERTLLKEQEVLGGYDKTQYVTERLWATVRDGIKVPMSLVYAKDRPHNAEQPLLLYAYGSYGITMEARFSSIRLSLLDRGFAFAIAHIRGGEEMGRHWYENGKLMHKMNTFNDFIDCAKYLIAEEYTSPAHLYAQGGSAGGLLMGAVVNMAAELFNGVLAEVPFVDVVNTMLDETIPLTTNEYDEWGNPNEEAAYHYIKAYSPYENIKPQVYPNLLITTGLHDSQVQYFEPAKWTAKLRDIKLGNQVVLLKTDMDYGHGGASGRFDFIRQYAEDFAFFMKLEGILK